MNTSEIVHKNNLKLSANCIPADCETITTFSDIDPHDEIFDYSFAEICQQNAIFLDQKI